MITNNRGLTRLQTDVLGMDLCSGCGACVGLCPYVTSFLGRTVVLDQCNLEEGRCFFFCPRTELDLDVLSRNLMGIPYGKGEIGTYRGAYSSRATETGTYQAGGTVTALLEYLFDKQMIDAAALTSMAGVLPMADVVTDTEGVRRAAGSKYSAAPTLSALNRAASDGHRKMAVVGTPCQVTATAKMRSTGGVERNPGDAVAYVIGLFCTWALDYRKLFAYLSGRIDIADITGFDIPPPPAERFVAKTKNGDISFPLSEIRPLVKESCKTCIDMTSEFADISVGVCEDDPSHNLLIVRTKQGEDLISGAAESGAIVVSEITEEKLVHLKESALAKKRRALTGLREKDPDNPWGYIVGPIDTLGTILK